MIPRQSRYHKKDIIEGMIAGNLPGEREIEMALIMKGEIRKLKGEHGVDIGGDKPAG